MPTFDEARRNLRDRRQENKDLRQNLNRDRNRLRVTDQRKSKIERIDPEGNSKLSLGLTSSQQDLSEQIAGTQQQQQTLVPLLDQAKFDFLPFSDPREQMSRMSDHTTILLFPLRLETRFKKVEAMEPAADSQLQRQMWVRAYPDDCLIDTFETIPSEAEYLRTRAYWINFYRAGQPAGGASEELTAEVRNRRLAAWNGLLEQSSAGRAYWLTQWIQPAAGQAPPFRKKVEDIILVIPTADDLDDNLKKPIAGVYEAQWKTPTDHNAIAAAMQQLPGQTCSRIAC